MGSSGDDLIIAAPDSKQVLIGGGGNDCLLGGQGHVALVASNLKDTDPAVGQDTPKNFNVLVAGDGDILVGGNGQDAFFFGAHCGSSTVLQFDPQHDKIVIDSHTTGITSVEQLHVQDDVKNHGVIIDINHGDRVEIIGHSTHDLIVSDDPNASAVMFIDSSAFAHGSGHS
jgi:Ca2+-binding RTX toxin-like protein